MTNMELYHYGIKGMRWGHRKARPTMSGAARSARRKRIAKRVALGVGAAAGAAALGYGAYRGKKYISTPHGAAHLMVGALRAQQGVDRAKGGAQKIGSTVGGYVLGGKRSARRAKLRSAADGASIIGNGVRLAGGIAAKRAGGAARRAADGASIIGNGARLAGGIAAKRAGGAARRAAGTVGEYALGGKHSSRRAGIKRAGAAARSAADGASIIGNGVRLAGGIAAKRAGGAIKSSASDVSQKLRQGRAAAELAADVYRTRRKYQGRHVSRSAHAAHFAYDSPGEALYHFALDPYGRYAIL